MVTAAFVIVNCVACTSSGVSGPATVGPLRPSSADRTYASATAARSDMCAVFDRFSADLGRPVLGGDQTRLADDLGDEHHGLIHAAIATGDGAVVDDATGLVGYVDGSDFPQNGTALATPVHKMAMDCGEK